jgi:hypothetical protein
LPVSFKGATLEIWTGIYGPEQVKFDAVGHEGPALIKIVKTHFSRGCSVETFNQCVHRSIHFTSKLLETFGRFAVILLKSTSVALEIRTITKSRLVSGE